MTSPGPGPTGTCVRRARAGEIDRLLAFLIDGRAHLSGSRHPALFRAFLADSFGPSPRTTVAIVEQDSAPVAALLAVNGDLPGWYRRLPLRHPRAALALAAHRARKLPNRLRGRRRARQAAPVGAATHRNVPDVLADEPRLRRGPPKAGEPGPRPSDHGPDLAFCLYVLVAPGHRGEGLGKLVLGASLRHLRAVGATRYDCSFDPRDVAATKLYLSMPFEIRRYPAGYFASIDLHQTEPQELAP